MTNQIDSIIMDLTLVKPLLASKNFKRADEMLNLIDRQLNGFDGLRQRVWLEYHRSGEGLKK